MSIYRAHHYVPGCALRGIFILAIITFFGALPLSAQRFHEIIGGTSPASVSAYAVVGAATGDLLAVGQETSATGVSQSYIVRTDASGNVLWQKNLAFIVSTSNTANDIKEYSNGDLAVVGTVSYPSVSRGYAARMTSAGAIIWLRTFAGNYQYNEANAVVITTQGTGAARSGDIVIAGTTYSPNYDGLLVRIDGNGNLVWSKTYDIPGGTGNTEDHLYDLDETRITSPQGTIGDIVAVGSTRGVPQGNLVDVWVLRVNGNTGAVSGAPYGSAIFGSVKDDIGYSIQELRKGAHQGNLAIAGASAGYPGTAINKIFAMQLYAAPCDPLNPRATTYLRNHEGLGTCIREITRDSVGRVGNTVVTGTIFPGPLGGLTDVVLQEFQEGTMVPAGQYFYYGGSSGEGAESVTEVVNPTTGKGYYAMAGYTDSPDLKPAGTGRALYLIRANSAKDAACRSGSTAPLSAAAGWPRVCTAITIANQTDIGSTLSSLNASPWYNFQACYLPTKPVVPGMHDRNANEAGAANALALVSYPNPVRGSDNLTLNYTLTVDGVAEVRIVDLFGRTVYTTSSERMKGTITEQVSTSGWTAGTYFVHVAANGHSVTARVVVVD